MAEPLRDPALSDRDVTTPMARPARAGDVPGGSAGPEPGRATRCSAHPARHAVGACAGCGRPLCISCAVPVRGVVVGPESLTSFVEDAPVVERGVGRSGRAGDVAVLAGFALVLASSVLPWTRFADPRLFGAWTWGWALLAPVAAIAGLAAVPLWRRWLDPRFQASALGLLAVVAGLGAVVYRLNPPLLAGSSLAPLLAVLGAAVALGGAIARAAAWRAS